MTGTAQKKQLTGFLPKGNKKKAMEKQNCLYTIIISVKTPMIHSVESVREGICALLSQSIGASKMQIIILNESGDREICELCSELQTGAPEQFMVLEGGRERLEPAMLHGTFLVYYNPLNMWTEDAFERIADYFDSAPESFDLCVCRIDDSKVSLKDMLKFRFKYGTRTSDVIWQYGHLQISLGNTVMRTCAVADPRESDLLLMNRIMMHNPKFGIMCDAAFIWYVNEPEQLVPVSDYRILAGLSKEKYGEVIPYIENLIVYCMRSYTSKEIARQQISELEKRQYFEDCREILCEIDDARLKAAPGLNQYQKLGIFYLKYGRDILHRTREVHGRLQYDGQDIFNLHGGDVFDIRVLSVMDGQLKLEGFTRVFFEGIDTSIYAVDQAENQYMPEVVDYKEQDFQDCYKQLLIKGKRFTFEIPLSKKTNVVFYVNLSGRAIRLFPRYGPDIPLNRDKTSYYEYDDYRISTEKGTLRVEPTVGKRKKTMLDAFLEAGTMLSRKGFSGLKVYRQNRYEEKLLLGEKLASRVAFVTPRSDAELLPNLKNTYDAYHGKKTMFHKKSPYSKADLEQAAEVMFRSKVVVTDDYFMPLRKYGKVKGQKVVQVWHAPGAFKKFGLDGTSLFPAVDRLYHKDYDLVAVSSENVREIYANAFGIDVEKVQALGFPRSDRFFDESYGERIRNAIYERYPLFSDKRIILYAPTFREGDGREKQRFEPNLDTDRLSAEMNADQVFVICPHPVMENRIVEKPYDNIFVVRDFSTTDMMFVADLLVTDYSSVIFEFSLLNKPMVFFCYDMDTYDRDFYLDYETELPGEVLKTQEELTTFLRETDYVPDKKASVFREKYMSACDGHSSQRVAEAIENMLKEQ